MTDPTDYAALIRDVRECRFDKCDACDVRVEQITALVASLTAERDEAEELVADFKEIAEEQEHRAVRAETALREIAEEAALWDDDYGAGVLSRQIVAKAEAAARLPVPDPRPLSEITAEARSYLVATALRSPVVGTRWELSFFIGPCSDEEADALAVAILDLPEFRAVGGGGVGMNRVDENDNPLPLDAGA